MKMTYFLNNISVFPHQDGSQAMALTQQANSQPSASVSVGRCRAGLKHKQTKQLLGAPNRENLNNLGIALLQLAILKMHQNTENHIQQIPNFPLPHLHPLSYK